MTSLHQCPYKCGQTIIKQHFNHLYSNWPNKSVLKDKLPTLSSEFNSLLAILLLICNLKNIALSSIISQCFIQVMDKLWL